MISQRSLPAVIFLLSFCITLSCQTSNAVNFSQNEDGIYLAHKPSIPKGAVRLTIEFTSAIEEVEGAFFADANVLAVNGFGETFATVRPRKGESIRLSVVGSIEGRAFKKGDKVKLDAMTPVLKEGQTLTISML